jgi:hypothetical protein
MVNMKALREELRQLIRDDEFGTGCYDFTKSVPNYALKLIPSFKAAILVARMANRLIAFDKELNAFAKRHLNHSKYGYYWHLTDTDERRLKIQAYQNASMGCWHNAAVVVSSCERLLKEKATGDSYTEINWIAKGFEGLYTVYRVLSNRVKEVDMQVVYDWYEHKDSPLVKENAGIV